MTAPNAPVVSRELLALLSNAVGVSGGESEVRQLILNAISNRLTDVTVDTLGSVVAHRPGTGGSGFRVLISAHLDESGLMVSNIGDDGLIETMAVGSLDKRYVPARRVLIGTAKTPGVLLWAPIHRNRSENLVAAEDMRIDVGAEGRGGVKAEIGDRIAFWSEYAALTETIVRGKAFDSRAGCAALIGLLDLLDGEPLPYDLYFAFTAQAHIGGRGAGVAANRIHPQAAFALTGVAANDLPKLPDADRTPLLKLGGGPVLGLRDTRGVMSRSLFEHVRAVADDQQIAYQVDARVTDPAQSGAISLSRSGVPTLSLNVPVRYLGSPNALLDLTDLDTLTRLIHASLSRLSPQILEN